MPTHSHIRGREAGFTLMELLVVMVIIAILAAISVFSVRASRATGRLLAASAAAHAYGNAADEFARDHGGRYPVAGGRDWPVAKDGPVAAQVGGTTHPYLRAVPESVQDGRIQVGTSGDAVLRYAQTNGGRGFQITVTVTSRPTCAVRGGDNNSTTPPDCAKR